MNADALRIARELAELLAARRERIDTRPRIVRARRRPAGYDRQSCPFPIELYCDLSVMPSADDPIGAINGHVPRARAFWRADQATLDRERDEWAPIIRAAAARYGGARRLKRRYAD